MEVRILPTDERLQKISVLTDVLKAAKEVYLPTKEEKDDLIKIAYDKLKEELKSL